MASNNKKRRCILCNSDVDDPLRLGQFHSHGGVTVHTYCLYLSSNLKQNGKDKSGIFGFLIADILREARRVRKLYCSYCRKNTASIGCSISKCPRSFHLACGISGGALCQFVGQFKSFCHRHLPLQPKNPQKKEKCAICLDALLSKNENATLVNIIQSPCCLNGWYHKCCLQHYANTSGYFFKCPLCNNLDQFREVALFGIFVPNCDAAWELEPGAFNELLQRETVCTAAFCRNPNGREATEDDLVYCQCCGSQPQHDDCRDSNEDYACNVCVLINKTTVNTNVQEEIELAAIHSTQSCVIDTNDSETDPLDEPITSFCGRVRNTSQILLNLEKEEEEGETSNNDDDDPLNYDDIWTYLNDPKLSVKNNDESECIVQVQRHVANHINQQTTNHSMEISCIANRVRHRHYKNNGSHRTASISKTGDDVEDQKVATNDNGVRRRRSLQNLIPIGNDSNAESDDGPNNRCNRTCKRIRLLSSTDEDELSDFSTTSASTQFATEGSISATTMSSTKSLSAMSRRSLSLSSLSSYNSISSASVSAATSTRTTSISSLSSYNSISSASVSTATSTRTTSISSATSTSTTRSSSPTPSMLPFVTRTSNRTNDIRNHKILCKRSAYLTAINEDTNSISESEESSTPTGSYAGKDVKREIQSPSAKSCAGMQNSSSITKNLTDRQQLQLIVSSSSDNEDLDMLDQSSDTSNCKQRKTNKNHHNTKGNKLNMQLSHEVSCIASRLRKRRSMTEEWQDNSDDSGRHVHTVNNNNKHANRFKENMLQDISCIANRVEQRRGPTIKCRRIKRRI